MIKVIVVSILVSAVVGATVALLVISILGNPAAPMANVERRDAVPRESRATPTATPLDQISPIEIKASDISILSIRTIYKDFYEENSKCRKTYNEYFGNNDGVYGGESPCAVTITFNRDGGSAIRTIEIRRWNKSEQQMGIIEKTAWAGKITAEQFGELARLVAENPAFKNWRDGMSVTVSNCTVSATHPKGVRGVMANVDSQTTEYLPMVEAFRQLNEKIRWEKVE